MFNATCTCNTRIKYTDLLNYLYMYMDHHGIMAFIVYVIIHKKNIEKHEKVPLLIIIRCD